MDEELYEKRTLGKTRCVRKTIYTHTKEMIPLVYAATSSAVEKASRQYMESPGVSFAEYEDISGEILGLLEGGGVTASGIRKHLETDLDVSAILYLMYDRGLLLRWRPEKGWRTRSHQYRVFQEILPDIDLKRMDEFKATALLVERYLGSFDPAPVNDIAWWTGLGKTKARRALDSLRDCIFPAAISGSQDDFIMLRSDEDRINKTEPSSELAISLLPTLDLYLVGYKNRNRYIHQENSDRVFDRSGNATSTILLDGKVASVWDFEDREEPVVKLFLFREAEPDTMERIRAEAHRIGEFISGDKVHLKLCRSMVPLTKRPAGGMMSPLKSC